MWSIRRGVYDQPSELRLHRQKAGDGQPDRPFILFEPKGADIPQLRGMMITLELRPDTTYDEARALCASMQAKQQAKRRSLALRFASVAASTWRHRRQVERLGLVAV